MKLIVFSGLPGVGKTELATQTARDVKAVYLRVDSFENPFIDMGEVNGRGYEAIEAVAEENLRIGNDVVIDLVNPLHQSRKMFVELATRTKSEFTQFECILSNKAVHRVRVEGRKRTDQYNPSWDEVIRRNYDVWDEAVDGERIVLNTLSKEEAMSTIMKEVTI